jgi:hypothetical protein
MDDDSRVIDKGWDTLPEYASKSGDADEAVTVSISTTPGEWLVNTIDAVVVPMSMADVVEALQNHKLTERSLVWRAGMQEWAPLEQVPQLKLAARMPKTPPGAVAPGRATAATAPPPSKPPPKPVRAAPGTHSVPPAVLPQSLPSRKSTLPFGLTAPLAGQPQSRPSNPRPSSPRLASPPTSRKEEPEVLAVYDRPAATISFDLSPVQPLRTTRSAPPTPPHTLAPTTTDSTQRRAQGPRNMDLSVVAASDFRQVQRSSKRLIVLSSLASAAAASLLTLALARSTASRSAAAHSQPLVAPVVTPAPVAPVVAPPPSALGASDAVPAPTPTSEASVTAAKPKPKPKASARRAKAASAVPARPDVDSTRDPASEPNPYDVKLDEDPPASKAPPAKAPPTAHGSGLEADASTPDPSTSSAPSPGF